MIRNKYSPLKQMVHRAYAGSRLAKKAKAMALPFRLRSFAKRLEARRAQTQAEKMATGKSPLFDHVEIETINRCNGECGFCPVNKHLDPRRMHKMPEELFASIMEQLGALDFRGALCLYSNNESLLDDRIERFAALAREKVPHCRLMLSTNGLLLTPDRYRGLIDSLDLLYVNNYCDDFRLTESNQTIAAVARGRAEWWEKTHIVVRYRREIMSSRGGQAPNKKDALPPRTLKVGCTFPASQLIIRPDGKLSLCCNDAIGVMTLGDLTRQTLTEAWHSEEYEGIREQILAGRDGLPLCRHCDTLGD